MTIHSIQGKLGITAKELLENETDRTLKTTALESITLPSEAMQEISAYREINNISDNTELGTSVTAKWITVNWIGAGSTVGLNFIPFVSEHLSLLPTVTGILTSMSAGVMFMILGFMTLGTLTDLNDHMKTLKKDITPNEWNYKSSQGTQGFRIYSKSRKNAIVELFLPRRMFRRILMNETVWYSPLRDVYTVKKAYLTGLDWVDEIQEIGGRRYVFQQSMKSL